MIEPERYGKTAYWIERVNKNPMNRYKDADYEARLELTRPNMKASKPLCRHVLALTAEFDAIIAGILRSNAEDDNNTSCRTFPVGGGHYQTSCS